MKQAFERLEKLFGKWLGNENTVACSSGTAALHLALEALQLEPGSKVVVPEFTMVACGRAVTMAGLQPVFVDCTDHLLIHPYFLDSSTKFGAIMPVHIYGRLCDMEGVMWAANKTGAFVIEDLAEAHGVKPHPETDAACWCLAGDTMVVLQDGRRCSINKIVPGDSILSATSNKVLDYVKVLAKRASSSEQVLRIKYQSGGSICCSKNHKILVEREGVEVWLNSCDIRVGDFVVHYKRIKEQSGKVESLDLCYLAGLIAADGSVSRKHVLQFSNRNAGLRCVWNDLCVKLFKKAPSKFHPKNDISRLCSESARLLMQQLEIDIENYGDDQIASYISGFADGDGCIFDKGNDSPAINLATFGEGEPELFRHLLFRLGIRSQFSKVSPRVRTFPNGITSNTVGGRCVVITDPVSVLRFIDRVGFRHPDKMKLARKWRDKLQFVNARHDKLDSFFVGELLKRARKKAGLSSGSIKSVNRAAVSLAERGMSRLSRSSVSDLAEELDSEELRRLANSDVYYWKVVEITEHSNESLLYDLSVSKNDCFFANGILVHNSFYKNKIVAGEEGGLVAFKSAEAAERARELRCLGFTKRHNFLHTPRGHNYRLANLLAEPIIASFYQMEENLKRRAEVESFYDSYIPNRWKMPIRAVCWVYDFRIPGMTHLQQETIVSNLNDIGVEARCSFRPMSAQKEYRVDGYGDLYAWKMSQEVMYLPVYPHMSKSEVYMAVGYLCDEVKRAGLW